MWSRLTEYASEIVAPPSDDESAGNAQLGDELWSRFANIVAPTDADGADQSGAKEDKFVANAGEDDDDEQERYISELERALLQKKKQNELLQARIDELEASETSALDDEVRDGETFASSQEKTDQISRLEAELAALKVVADTRATQEAQATAQTKRLEDQNSLLQRRVAELDVQCGVLVATLREERAAPTNRKAPIQDTNANYNTDGAEPPTASILPSLVQTALVLSRSVRSAQGDILVVGTTEEEIASQLLELSESTRQRIEQAESSLAKLHASLASFFRMQSVEIASDEVSFFGAVQQKLGVLSHRLSKATSDAAELEHVQSQLKLQAEKDEKNRKLISALQTQLAGVQASKAKNDESVASRESHMAVVVEKREKVIANLEASEQQLKHTLEHMGKELADAHTEADELEMVCREQHQELTRLQKKCEEVSDLQRANEELQSRLQELENSARDYERGYMDLLVEAESVKKQTEEEKAELVASTEANVISTEQQMLYELQARLSASEADKLIAIQDADRLQSELDALDKVLLQFRVDHKQQRERLLELEQALEDSHRASPHRGSADQEAISEEDFRRVMDVLSKRTQECDQLREALENSAKRFSSETDVLDKRLAAQLVVSYLESDKKHEVLQLMSRMMGFTEEEKHRAGILGDGHVVIPGNGGGGLFSSIFGIQSSSAHAQEAAISGSAEMTTDGKNINELWTNFLIDEAKR